MLVAANLDEPNSVTSGARLGDEYSSLRAEIKLWQDRRFAVLSGAIVLVTTILGLKVVGESPSKASWIWVTALLWSILACACLLSWYAAAAAARLGAYLAVFHEGNLPGWETRRQRLREIGSSKLNLESVLVAMYLALAIAALLAPRSAHLEYPVSKSDVAVLLSTGSLLAASLALLLRGPSRRQCVNDWLRIREGETAGHRSVADTVESIMTERELDQLKLVTEYVKFHIGLYLATPPIMAILAESLGVEKSGWSRFGIAAMVLIYLVSGAHAGLFMGEFINKEWTSERLAALQIKAYSRSRRVFHHWLYWGGLIVAILAVGIARCCAG